MERVHPFGQIVPIHERGLLHDGVILKEKKIKKMSISCRVS